MVVQSVAEEVVHRRPVFLCLERRQVGLERPGHRHLAREVLLAEEELGERQPAALAGIPEPHRGLILVGVVQPRDAHDRA